MLRLICSFLLHYVLKLSAQELITPSKQVLTGVDFSPSPIKGCDAAEIARAAWTRYWSDCLHGDSMTFQCLQETSPHRANSFSDEEIYLNSTTNVAKIKTLWSAQVQHDDSIIQRRTLSNRVAVILNGQARTFFLPEVQRSFQVFVLESLKNGSMRVDLFVAVKYEMSYTWQYVLGGLSRDDVVTDIDKHFINGMIESWGLQTAFVTVPVNASQKYAQHLAFQSVLQTEAEQSIVYKYVLVLRPDMAFTKPIFFPTDFVVTMYWDFGFLTPRRYADVMCSEHISWGNEHDHVARCLSFLSPQDQILNVSEGQITALHLNFWASIHPLRHGILHHGGQNFHLVRPSNTTRTIYVELHKMWVASQQF